MLKKIAIGILLTLAITQIVLIILQILQITNLTLTWLFAPTLVAVLLGTVFMVVYVLKAENKEK